MTEAEREQRHLNGFQRRVDIAAAHIASGRPITRSLDSCFENFDGEAVSHALFRRASNNPKGKLAQNIANYLCGHANEAAKRNGPGMTLEDLRKMSLDNFRAMRKQWEQIRPDRTPSSTELTETGEQHVIPGCEHNASPTAKQLNLF
jgi:hypothetical protein